MNISVSMYSLASIVKEENWSIVDFINYAEHISLEGVELLDIYWPSNGNQKEEIEKVMTAVQKSDLQVSAYNITNNFVKESSKDRIEEVNKVLNGIEVAKKLGCNIVRVFGGDIHDDITYEQGFDWIIDGLKQCAVRAEQEKVYLAVENHGLLAGKSDQVKEIIEAINSPYVKSTFDTGNFLLVHEKPTEAFDKLKNEIVHVHFKDFRKKMKSESIKGFRSTEGIELIGVIPGDGEVDLAYIIKGLKEINYDGWVSIEYEGHDNAKKANEEAINRLEKLLE